MKPAPPLWADGPVSAAISSPENDTFAAADRICPAPHNGGVVRETIGVETAGADGD